MTEKHNIENEFYAVKGTFGGVERFLGADETESNGYKWVKRSDAIWWEHKEDAESFANSYFKNFEDWEVVTVYAEV